jgi:ankyrin repeat protein
MLRSIYSQGHELSRVTLDILIPQVLQHASPETLNQILRRAAQNQESLPPIDDRELEELGMHFLSSISRSPDWSNNLSFADENNQTIAHLCAISGYTRLLTKVVDWGIDLDVRDVSGLTALHCAYLREDWDCVGILKGAGADESIRDNLGRLPREMCQHPEYEGSMFSEREAASSPVQFSSPGEGDWVDLCRVSTSPEDSILLGTRLMPQLPLQSPSGIKATSSPMPVPRPASEGSFSADDDTWAQAFGNLQISGPPQSSVRPPSNSSRGRARGGMTPGYGWANSTYPLLSPTLSRNVSSGAAGRLRSLPTTSSFNPMPAFPMPQPAVLSFPVPEPTVFQEDTDDDTDSPSRQSPSPRCSPSPRIDGPSISRYHTPAQTPSLHVQQVTRANVLAVSRPRSSQSTPRSHQPSPSGSSPRYGPPPGPPPTLPLSSSKGGVAGSPQRLSQYEKDEKAAMRQQIQEAVKMWPSAEQEKERESIKFKAEQKPVPLDKGALADSMARTRRGLNIP